MTSPNPATCPKCGRGNVQRILGILQTGQTHADMPVVYTNTITDTIDTTIQSTLIQSELAVRLQPPEFIRQTPSIPTPPKPHPNPTEYIESVRTPYRKWQVVGIVIAVFFGLGTWANITNYSGRTPIWLIVATGIITLFGVWLAWTNYQKHQSVPRHIRSRTQAERDAVTIKNEKMMEAYENTIEPLRQVQRAKERYWRLYYCHTDALIFDPDDKNHRTYEIYDLEKCLRDA